MLVAACAGCGTLRSNVELCPNWERALPEARKIAGCGDHDQAAPDSRCVAAIMQCRGGCDICRFLGGRDEIKIQVADKDEWAPIARAPIDELHRNGYDGVRAREEVGIFSRTYKLNWHLCNDDNCLDILASTIVHEAMHACAPLNRPGILDYRLKLSSPGCSAEELEYVCASK